MSEEKAPMNDQRYRTHQSQLFYVAEMIGTGLYFTDSQQRVVHHSADGARLVTYKNKYVPLGTPREMKEMIMSHLQKGGFAMIGDSRLDPGAKEIDFEAFHFVNAIESEDAAYFEQYISEQKR